MLFLGQFRLTSDLPCLRPPSRRACSSTTSCIARLSTIHLRRDASAGCVARVRQRHRASRVRHDSPSPRCVDGMRRARLSTTSCIARSSTIHIRRDASAGCVARVRQRHRASRVRRRFAFFAMRRRDASRAFVDDIVRRAFVDDSPSSRCVGGMRRARSSTIRLRRDASSVRRRFTLVAMRRRSIKCRVDATDALEDRCCRRAPPREEGEGEG